jgi:chromodomain-helicase-DNA-binding protein 7
MVVQFILAVRKGKREVKGESEEKPVTSEEVGENSVSATAESSEKVIEEKKEPDVVESNEDKDKDIPETPKGKTSPESKTVELEEYYVKYRNFSYLHCEWKTEDELYKGDKRISAKLKRFKQKMAHHANIFENVCILLIYLF